MKKMSYYTQVTKDGQVNKQVIPNVGQKRSQFRELLEAPLGQTARNHPHLPQASHTCVIFKKVSEKGGKTFSRETEVAI